MNQNKRSKIQKDINLQNLKFQEPDFQLALTKGTVFQHYTNSCKSNFS